MAQILKLEVSDFTGYKTETELASFTSNNRSMYGRIKLLQITHTTTARVEYEIIVGGESFGKLSNFYNAVEIFNKIESFLEEHDVTGLMAAIADKASLEPRIQTSI